MATKGRPKTLENRTNTSISLPQEYLDFMKSSGKDNSAYIRELIAEKMKSMESPIGKIRQEIEEHKKHVEEELFLIQMLETRLAEEEEKVAKQMQERVEEEEKRRNLREFIINRFSFISNHTRPKDFLEYLCDTYGLKDNQEAKKCIFNTLLEEGHSEANLKKINMLKGL